MHDALELQRARLRRAATQQVAVAALFENVGEAGAMIDRAVELMARHRALGGEDGAAAETRQNSFTSR